MAAAGAAARPSLWTSLPHSSEGGTAARLSSGKACHSAAAREQPLGWPNKQAAGTAARPSHQTGRGRPNKQAAALKNWLMGLF